MALCAWLLSTRAAQSSRRGAFDMVLYETGDYGHKDSLREEGETQGSRQIKKKEHIGLSKFCNHFWGGRLQMRLLKSSGLA